VSHQIYMCLIPYNTGFLQSLSFFFHTFISDNDNDDDD